MVAAAVAAEGTVVVGSSVAAGAASRGTVAAVQGDSVAQAALDPRAMGVDAAIGGATWDAGRYLTAGKPGVQRTAPTANSKTGTIQKDEWSTRKGGHQSVRENIIVDYDNSENIKIYTDIGQDNSITVGYEPHYTHHRDKSTIILDKARND